MNDSWIIVNLENEHPTSIAQMKLWCSECVGKQGEVWIAMQKKQHLSQDRRTTFMFLHDQDAVTFSLTWK